MRGIENILSFVLLFTLLIVLAYLSSTTLIQYVASSAYAERRFLQKYNLALAITYTGRCTDQNTIEINYDARVSEYRVRLLCIYDQNAEVCVVPQIGGTKSISVLAPWVVPLPLEYNIAACGWDTSICQKLRCYMLGTYRAYPLPIT